MSKRTDALAVVGKKTEVDDSTLAAETFFGNKDSSKRKTYQRSVYFLWVHHVLIAC